ncbi:HAMP domain-containing histidine kinase [Pelomonas sp. V22]|uniref:sensor histidine kinase n=1 Tax=Pelomonas sp. V22 TaxID=2822139 RepID=UPI0024A967F2|nr:HAMP domain-containing sensor histidine kinase [Pelomonas sp. V22]MDI4631948.1 HAMP domain-containing histidine kinase [Pelomonas sp. V22]
MLLKQSSLRYAVVAALGLGLLLPTIASLVLEMNYAESVAKEDLQRDLSRSTEVLALSLAEPVWQVSPDLAEPMIKAQVNDPRFVSVLVVEPSNPKPFYETPQRADVDPKLTLSETRPVQRDGREIAKLTVVMSAEPFLARKRADLWNQVLRTAATLIICALATLVALRTRVLQPMSRLSAAAEELAAGHLEKPLEVAGGDDEIARVGTAMERMRQALLAAFESLRMHNNTLEDQVSQRTNELTRANNELTTTLRNLQTAQRELVEAEKLASLGRLVAGVAHELNTPLGNALTVVSALEDRYNQLDQMMSSQTPIRRSLLEELVKDTRRGQDILQRNVQKAADLVRDFKQVAINQTNDARGEFDLTRVVESQLVMVEPSFKRTRYEIVTELQPGLLLDSYPGALGQVLTNLLMNALLHGFDGLEQGKVRISSRRISDDEVEVSVEDDGRGMDESVRRQIFDPFFTTKLGTGGSGLGMHIVHNIVTNVLGGSIEVISAPGKGCHMLVRIPRVAPERASADEAGG